MFECTEMYVHSQGWVEKSLNGNWHLICFEKILLFFQNVHWFEKILLIFSKCLLFWKKNSSYFLQKLICYEKKFFLFFPHGFVIVLKVCYCFESLLLFWKHRYVRLRICGFWRCSERWQSIAMSVREKSFGVGWQRQAAAGRKIDNFEERLWYSWITLSPNFWLLSHFRWSQIVRKLEIRKFCIEFKRFEASCALRAKSFDTWAMFDDAGCKGVQH